MSGLEKTRSGAKSNLITAALLFCAVTFLALIATPNFVRSGPTLKSKCINNLRQIAGGKQQWALENQKETNVVPTITDVSSYLKNNQFPVCPTKGKYTIGRVADDPTCSIPGHVLPPP